MSTESVSRRIERDTPSLQQRLEGLRRCQEAGYRIRVGFSPIIPVRDWRREATDALEALFSRVSPEVIRLWVISLMTCADFELCVDPVLIDPRFLAAARDAGPELDPRLPPFRPFPQAVRREIYSYYIDEIARIQPETRVGLCTEERDVWNALRSRLRMTPETLFCCCGGYSAGRP